MCIFTIKYNPVYQLKYWFVIKIRSKVELCDNMYISI